MNIEDISNIQTYTTKSFDTSKKKESQEIEEEDEVLSYSFPGVEGDGGAQVLQSFGGISSVISSFSDTELDDYSDSEEEDDDDDSFSEDYGADDAAGYESAASDVDFAEVATSISRDKLLVEQDEIRNKLLAERNSVSEEKRERLKQLCNQVQASDGHTITAEDIAELYDYPLDKFQQIAINGFLKGSSLVVCAPTSSGKTLVAEAAAAATLARGKRLFYTTPLKALSNQKLRDFRVLFGEENVGLLTGDAAVNREAPILIMTTEILRNMLYQSVGSIEEGGRLMDVDVVVLDEVHYLSDISRGTVWEETVIYCPKEVQLICLSATVANPEELAGWISQVHGPTELVTSSKRPVPLVWHFSTRSCLLPLLSDEGTGMNMDLHLRAQRQDSSPVNGHGRRHLKGFLWGELEQELSYDEIQNLRRRQVPQIRTTLFQLKEREMLPAIWFIFSRKGCDRAVHYLHQDVQLLSTDEEREIRKALVAFGAKHPEALRELGVRPLLRGIAAHHAGCLPTWKSFIEELFQRGLVKVVFATETLAAGINMPARTTVLASLSKRGDNGHALLSSNSMLQMAGRAGRRGIDKQGHVVVVQTPFEGAEDCCRLLFAGSDPLVSQFTATYGMALNLLAGERIIKPDGSIIRRGRTLEEARALIEQSFGNYVGSEVMVAARQKVAQLQQEIARLEKETTKDSANSLESRLTKDELQEYTMLKEGVQEAKRMMRELRREVEVLRADMVDPLLENCSDCHPPFICLNYFEQQTGKESLVPALFVGKVPRPSYIDSLVQSETKAAQSQEPEGDRDDDYPELEGFMSTSHYTALGSDNCWYMFTAKSVKSVHQNDLNFGVPTSPDEKPVRAILNEKLRISTRSWESLGRTGSGLLSSVCSSESSMDTWAWGCQVPLLSELSVAHEVSLDLVKAERRLSDQRKLVSKLRKQLRATQGHRETKLLMGLQKMQIEKISRLQAKTARISARISQMQPTGWKEFLQVVKVLQEVGAIETDSHSLLPLGEVAAAVRGVNELWLAIIFTSETLLSLDAPQLAAVCASFVSEGIKARSKEGPSSIYNASRDVHNCVAATEEMSTVIQKLQTRHGVQIPIEVDTQFAGLVEAWAAGVTWKELMSQCGMDDGDVARLIRRSIDLLAQIPHLPHVDPGLAKTAKAAAHVMDRPPISELIG
ncbi:unnamed protein product [Sphagnum troendelagicum]